MIRTGPREIADGEIRLREVALEDTAALYRWRMDPRARLMFLSTEIVPFPEHASYVRRYFQDDNTDHWFMVEAQDRPVGTIALYDRTPDGREAEWGRFVLAPAHRGRGWGRRALALLMEHARQAGVARLYCEVLAGNSAERLYRGLGFVETGAREHRGRRFLQLVAELAPEA